MMKRNCFFALVLVLSQAAVAATAFAQAELKRVTLYALNKHDASRALFSFQAGKFEGDSALWDLNYGSLYVGDDLDWFSVSTEKETRSAARDLGELSWADDFIVPVIEPFPKLKEGEMRRVTVDASGADGADGTPGTPGQDGADGDGIVRPNPARPAAQIAAQGVRKEKRSGVPKVDPVYVKAILGHVYVMRVVANDSDFYVLFRVEALERGDNCTISWKRIPSPPESVGKQ